MYDFIITSLAIAAVSITITKSSIFKECRESIFLAPIKKLLNCPYCLSHWLVLPFAFKFGFIGALALIAMSSIISLPILIFLEKLDATVHDS